jgi:Permuted papain-like amidase enzyme, YaeF/YiiX, C92 family
MWFPLKKTAACFAGLLPVLLLLCPALLLSACGQQAPAADATELQKQARLQRAVAAVDSIQPLIQSGDLVLRTGNDFTSESLRLLNRRNKEYSHCGIASIEQGQVFVYHSLGGEFNPDQKIRRDAIQVFAEPSGNKKIAVYRYSLPPAANIHLVEVARLLYRAGIMFDMSFDLATDERMYCAEYVYKSLLLGSNGSFKCTTSHISDFEFVGVDDLFLHPLCSRITAIVYK